MTVPSYEYISSLICCDFETGVLRWRERPSSMFASLRSHASWNAKNSGRQCGWVGADGYRRLTIGPKSYLCHRIVWLLFHKAWPIGMIDHKNRNLSDCSIANLGEVNASGNAMNRKLSTANKSGQVGVYKCSKSGLWRADIKVRGKKIFIGRFEVFEDAVQARKGMQVKLGFSPIHGEIVR